MGNASRVGPMLVAALVAASTPVAAQDTGTADPSGASARDADVPAPDLRRAEALFEEALRLEAEPRTRARAAEAFLESARLRPYGDLEAYVALERAGALYADLGERRQAEEAFVRAAVRALETGRVYEASLAFVSASELARSDPDAADRLIDYGRQAFRLSGSPLLTEEQRRSVRRHLDLDGG